MRYRNICLLFLLIPVITSYAALRDPTQPAIDSTIDTMSSSVGTFNLQTIIVSPTRIRAMIDGQIVGVGSEVHGARVLAIGKNHVVLLYGGQKKTIFLFGKRLWKAR